MTRKWLKSRSIYTDAVDYGVHRQQVITHLFVGAANVVRATRYVRLAKGSVTQSIMTVWNFLKISTSRDVL